MFIIVEFGIIFLFLTTLVYIIKKDKKEIFLFLLSFLYATLFENFNILLSFGQTGSYYYNEKFMFNIFHVPLFVALSWSIIIYSSKKISETLPIKNISMFFAASFLVLLIDFTIDIIAIRLYYWYWVGYEFNEGFFGVPANNYIGWLLVSFVFYNIFHFFEQRNINIFTKSLIILSSSYLLFLLIFLGINQINQILNFDKNQQFITLVFLLVIFLFFIRYDEKKVKIDKFSILIRLPFYFFVLSVLIIERMYINDVGILFVTIVFIFFEFLLFLLMWYYGYKQKNKDGFDKNFEKNRFSKR